MFQTRFDRTRPGALAHTVAEKFGIHVHMSDKNIAATDTEKITLASPEVFAKMGMTDEQAQEVVMYTAGHEGAHVLLSDIKAIQTVMTKATREGRDLDALNHFLQIIEDYRVDNLTIKARPGYADFRERAASLLNSTLKPYPPSGDKMKDMASALSDATYNTDVRALNPSHRTAWEGAVDFSMVDDMIAQIKALVENPSTSYDSADLAMKFYDMMGGKKDDTGKEGKGEDNKGKDDEQNGEPMTGGGSSKGEKNKKEEKTKDNQLSAQFNSPNDNPIGESSELTKEQKEAIKKAMDSLMDSLPGKIEMPEEVESALRQAEREEAHRKADEKTAKAYARSFMSGRRKIFPPDIDEQFIREVSVETHAGVPINYAGMSSEEEVPESSLEDRLQRAISITKMASSPDGQAKQLGNRLIADLRAAKDPQAYTSDNGIVQANNVWKTKTGNDRVFSKSAYDEEGEFVVSILLDASGSQGGRESAIRIQAYILAEALSMARIPFNVCSFSNSTSGTNIRQFIGFDDDKSKNLRTMLYDSDGDNRDGHAIKGLGWIIKRRPEQHKVLIVLSDGQPSDTFAKRIPSVTSLGGMYKYSMGHEDERFKISAIDDTAMQVRKLRSEGVNLLGVYVGYEHNLPVERTIYGNDFAYIRAMDDFANIVGGYLHKQIVKALE